ncbi:tetratricopeptide repeat protein [Nisaea sediminum]|uniref:tetratricopeptide repeat protein n=1 Tax=Nisaea sediminum TaxID=2775867 RepID=UPI0018691168|nr:tetratricopeptide repeat protein [Nisaea sediminum]
MTPSPGDEARRAELRAEAGAAFRAGNMAAAIDMLRRYVCLFPEDAGGYGNLLAVARRTRMNSDVLVRLARHALFLEPAVPGPMAALLTALAQRREALPAELEEIMSRYGGAQEVALARAIQLHRLGRPVCAETIIRRTLIEMPDRPRLYQQLGLQRQEDGGRDPGRAFREALFAADAKSPEMAAASEHLAANLHAAGDLLRAVDLYRTALARAPGAAGLRANLAAALVDCGEAEAAETELRQTLILDPKHRDGLWLSSCLRIGAGDLSGGYRAHHVRWTEPHEGARSLEFGSLPLWLGQPVKGRRILVWGDFGIGDEIIFAPLAQWLAELGAEVTLETDPRLVALCRRSFPGVAVEARDDAPRHLERFDYHVPSALLACFHERTGRSPDLHPFKADPDRVTELGEALGSARGGARLVGFSWGGGGARTSWSKSTELTEWEPLLSSPEIRLVSLQYAGGGASGELPERILPSPVSDLRNDLDGLAALIACLDATVSISGINAHMAGALRRPGFILLPRLPLWFWGREGSGSRWYPSLRLFRRSDSGWGAPIANLSESVRRFLSL